MDSESTNHRLDHHRTFYRNTINISDEPVLGCNSDNLWRRDLYNQIMNAIERKDLTVDGIYRACGNQPKIENL